MTEVIGIRFKNNPKIYDFLKPEDEVDIGDIVIVETPFGTEFAYVVYVDKKVKEKKESFQKILRKATSKDFENQRRNEKNKEKYEKEFIKLVKQNNLDMKFIDVEFSFDNKVIFLFTAENRVDFRELVRDLTKSFKKQIRLKQIGPRDESRYLGGYGQCGRLLCCKQFLGVIESVTMDMARDQEMASKGSVKISGVCGRLMCCLVFEDELYKEILNNLPKIGEKIKTKQGIGNIIEVNALSKKAEVELSDGSKIRIDL